MTTATAETKTATPKSQVKRKTIQSAQPTTKTEKVVTPKLVCQVTGVGRYTNAAYLQKKADQRNCTTAEILSHYVSREVAKLLRTGKTIVEIQGILGATYESPIAGVEAATILRFNGKTKSKKD
jgi:hypothetical protein